VAYGSFAVGKRLLCGRCAVALRWPKKGFPYTIAPVVQVDLSFARIVALLKSRKPKPNRITITKVTRAFEKRGSDATPCLVAELAI